MKIDHIIAAIDEPLGFLERACYLSSTLIADEARMAAYVSQHPSQHPSQYCAEKHSSEKNLRCANYGFAVKKTGRCDTWEAK